MCVARVFLTLLVGIFFIGDVHAISKKNHQSVTTKAMEEYRKCTKRLGVADTLTKGEASIVKATQLEDKATFTRYFNWHFYDAYKDTEYAMGKSTTGAWKSLHHIYNKRADSLVDSFNESRSQDIYEYSGRLIHYIQDMTVPAHVAPIYHYKFRWIDRSDYFDSMPEWRTSQFNPPSDLCDIEKTSLNDIKKRLNEILETTAKRTRDRIREKIVVNDGHSLKGKSWEEFWILRNPKNDSAYSGTKLGFSPYGNQNREGFKNLCETDRDICIDFFKQSFQEALISTVKALLLINSINADLTVRRQPT